MNEDGSDTTRPSAEVPEFRRIRSEPLPPQQVPPRRSGAGRPLPWMPSAAARRRRAALLLSGFLSALVLLASGTAWSVTGWLSGQLQRYDVFTGLLEGDRPDAGARGALNFLVIGSDDRSGLDAGQRSELGVGNVEGRRSDTIMLVHLNHERDHITVVGIPRDSWVQIPGHGPHKINAAYSLGGPSLAVQTVESVTGVRIDHYVEIDFTGFVEVVDALGGITVCLPEAIHDEKAHLSLEAGTHELDGVQALAFARTRKSPHGDLDRIDRQQQVLSALLDRALDSQTLSDPARFTRFLETALGSVTVDEALDTAALNQLGSQLRTVGLEDVTFTQVPVDRIDFWTPSGEVAVTWHEQRAAELFNAIAADRPVLTEEAEADPVLPEPGEVVVEVYNGTGVSGLGGRLRAELLAAGFQVPAEAGNWVRHDLAETLVRYSSDSQDAAVLLLESIPGARPEEDPALGGRVQVVAGANLTGVAVPADLASREAEQPVDVGGRDAVHTSTAADNICR
ncbi:transcriptional regulator [Thermobifida cellulosilytica TB100]|uniref:Transcriptional regulator n=2 Tax=Thermobifida cellulosilytica TaxID=144786 RepID=A0A147KG16_THECS|nr:transcriptional regulator [Thermobifida cellulosilytica TB100]